MRVVMLVTFVDESKPMAERIITGAIKGIMPSLRRVALTTEYQVYDTDESEESVMTGTNQNFDPERWKAHVDNYRAAVARVTPPPSGSGSKTK